MGQAVSNFLLRQCGRGAEVPGVKDLFILAQDGQCKQMVFDGISRVISQTRVNWKMIHYISRTFGGFSSRGGRGRAGGHLVRKGPPLGAAQPRKENLGRSSLASGKPLSGEAALRWEFCTGLPEPFFFPPGSLLLCGGELGCFWTISTVQTLFIHPQGAQAL